MTARAHAFPVVPTGDPHMASPLNTPPVEVQMQTKAEEPLRLRDQLWVAGATVYAIGAWAVLIWAVS